MKNENMIEKFIPNGIVSGEAVSPEALARMGGGKLAYVTPIRSEDVQTMFPQAPSIAPGI